MNTSNITDLLFRMYSHRDMSAADAYLLIEWLTTVPHSRRERARAKILARVAAECARRLNSRKSRLET